MKFRPGKWKFAVAVLAVTGTGLLAWKHEGILKRISDQRAASHLSKAIEAGGNGEWKTSERLSLAAWQLKEGDPAILRQLYHSAKELQSKHLLYAAGALFDHPEATAEDRIDVVHLHLGIGDHVRTKALLSALSPGELQEPEAMEAAVRFFLARNDLMRALALVEKLQQTRGTPEDTLLAARVIARIPTEANKASARAQAMIQSLFLRKEDPEIALSAFAILRSIPREQWQPERFRNARERLAELRSGEQFVPVELDFLAVELLMALEPALRESLLEEAIREKEEAAPAPLAAWLLSLGETGRVKQLIPEERTGTSPALFLTLVRAHLGDHEWKEARNLLSNPHPQLPHPLVHAMIAVTATGLGENANSREHWERALRHATLLSGRTALLELAKMAAGAGEADIRNRALTEALQRPSVVALPAADVGFLFSYLAGEENAEDLLHISRNLLRNEPDNPILLNNVLWLELILGKESGKVHSGQVAELVDRFPGIPTLQATLALSLLEEERHGEALTAARALQGGGSGRELSATDHAVISLVRKRAGSMSGHLPGSPIDWSDMMEVEKNYFQQALMDSVTAATP